MIRLNFVLKETKAEKETLIVCAIRMDNKRFNLSTKRKVNPKYWDNDKQRIKSTINVSNCNEINKELSTIKEILEAIYNNFINKYDRKPSKDELKNLFDLEYFQKIPQFKKVKVKSILDYFDDYINTIKSITTNSTVQKYQQAKNNFEDFQKLKKRIYNPEMINLDFRNDYVEYLIEIKKYAPTTVYRKMKFLKTVLFFMESLEVKVNPFIHNDKFLTKDGKVDNIALTEKELAEIESLDLSNNKRLEQVRDLFLIACYTGQRFSDLNKIDKSNIIDNNYISIRQQKTKEPITLPLLNSVRKVLIKYDYRLPKISNVKFNEYIKEVAEKCDTLHKAFSSEKTTPRYKMVSSHTARRTFVTLNYSKGIDLDTLKIGTGHKQTKTLHTYIFMNDTQKADLLRDKLEPKEEPQSKAKVISINKASNQ